MDANALFGSIAFVFMTGVVTTGLAYFYFGGRSKTYEELWEENKQLLAANRSLVQSGYTKPKEKKNKKAKKGIKNTTAQAPEEAAPKETSWESVEESTDREEGKPQSKPKSNGSKAKTQTKQPKSHVIFLDNVEEPSEKEAASKKRAKKVRPILDKSSKTEIIYPVAGTVPVVNHFESTHPKDEFELLLSNTKLETKTEKAPKKNKQPKPDAQPVEKSNATEQPEVIVEKEKTKEESTIAVVQEPSSAASSGKEKKKKKTEFNSKQPIPGDKIIEAIRNSEISHIESQLLVDLILNKQQGHSIITDEWTEGKSDPVQKLKKQLADKEKQVADGQEALAAVQAKLKEVRMEQQSEKSQLQQLLNNRNVLQQRIQELEELRSAENANLQRLVEENKALKMQLNQIEATLITFQETDAHIKAENLQLSNQLQLLTRQRQEQDTNYQNCVIKLQALESNHSYALSAAQEETRKLADQLIITSETFAQEEQNRNEMIAQLQAELQQIKEERREQINGSTQETKEQEIQILNLTNEVAYLKTELSNVSQALYDEEIQFKIDLATADQKCNRLESELNEHRNKNDELRKKNWKLVEALKTAETRYTTVSHKSTEVDNDLPEQADAIQDNRAEMVKLKLQADQYSTALDESVATLNALQDQIIAEESTWRTLLAEKDQEIRDLKTQCISKLENKILALESQLTRMEDEKLSVLESLKLRPNNHSAISSQGDCLVTQEQSSEEVDRLRQQLSILESSRESKGSEANGCENGETS